MSKKRGLIFLVSMFALIFSVSLVSAQTEGIPLQKDIILGVPILGPADLPAEITFTLYDAQNGLTPLGSQTFTRGQYTVDFEFSQSDGVTGGSVARVKADFTNTLNLKDGSGQTIKPTEIWAALEVAGAEVGPRSKVSDETLVRLLLNSDASLATYLTLAYEGDDNPITTIYKDLPISLTSADGSKLSLADYFSGVVAGTGDRQGGLGSTTDPYWERDTGYLYYNDGNVGIGTSNPVTTLHLVGRNAYLERRTENPWAPGLVGRKSRSGANLQNGDATIALTGQGLYGGSWMNVGNIEIGVDGPPTASSVPGVIKFYTTTSGSGSYTEKMVVTNSGSVGIGTSAPGSYKLAVEGKIGCRELTVTSVAWADFVFEDNYRLPPLKEVELFISENKHLRGIPTETEVKEKGVSVGNISSKLLQKIEELTLYVIDINRENEALKARLGGLESQLKEMRNWKESQF